MELDSAATPLTLVAATASDGIRLDGALISAPNPAPSPVLLWIHGFGANFYFAPYVRLARDLATQGISSILANTRGHDLGVLLQPPGRPAYWGGGLWERLDESPNDLAGWTAFAIASGFPSVVLLGHSLGAVKAVHYLAQTNDHRVSGLVLASPPLRPSWDTRSHPAALAEAQSLIERDEPQAIFAGPWGQVSAQTYVGFDRVGFDQFGRATVDPGLSRVRCPVLVAIGSEDAQTCTTADLDIIERHAVDIPSLEMHVIPGADHFFAAKEREFSSRVARWMKARSVEPASGAAATIRPAS